METAEIRYRVVDFLKQHAPFHAIAEVDLLALVEGGRVRFHEPNEYILWQGEPHKAFVFVIQQGTVSLWDESGDRAGLRDVRGAGDLLGLERYTGARSCLYSARSESDTVLYALPAHEFDTHVLKYPHAAQYVTAEGHVTADYQPSGTRRDPRAVFLHDVVGRKPLTTCSPTDTIAEAARRLLSSPSGAMAVVDGAHRARAVLSPSTILEWVAAGGGDANVPVARLADATPVALGPRASVSEGVLTMGRGGVEAMAVTADGSTEGALQAVVTARDLAAVFGEQPTLLLHEIRRASTLTELRELNRRARNFTFEFLAGASSVEWLARYTESVDTAILARVLALEELGPVPGCWCVCGSSGRAEALTLLMPYLLLVLPDERELASAQAGYARVLEALHECDYLPRLDLPFDPLFHVASAAEWRARYTQWIVDPVMQQTYRARALFDLRPVFGDRGLFQALEASVMQAVNRDFIHVLANDCLASLPPLTFFHDEVVNDVGEHSAVFRLQHSALRPLVDVGRVFGLAARQVMGRSTLERFAIARTLLPDREAIFREASDTLRIVLWQQARVGISQGTPGYDLPPALLSRYDRQVLKGGFRSILRLLEFTADRQWVDGV